MIAIITDFRFSFLFFIQTAEWMAQTEKYRSVDSVLPDLQETAVSMGAVGWPPGKL